MVVDTADQFVEMEERQLVKLVVHGLWIKGRLWVFDWDGQPVTSFPVERLAKIAKSATPEELAHFQEWGSWARRSSRKAGERARNASDTSDWGRKFQSMAQSARSRKKVMRSKRPGGRGNSELRAKRTWQESIDRMMAKCKYRYRKRSRWEKWSDSVASNANKRAAKREAKRQAEGTCHSNQDAIAAGASRSQMCFDW